MKKILSQLSLFLVMVLAIWACKKSDSMDPAIDGIAIDNYDVVQLTNDNPDVPVYMTFSDDAGIDSVAIRIMKEGTTDVVARNVIKNITHLNAERIQVNTPFPYPDLGGPTGVYTIEYTIYDKKGKTSTKSYNVNILNNKIRNLCTFPNTALPPGKNTWIRVTSTQPLAANEDVYITGSFEAANGGAGDWTGGVSTFKLTRISNQCFMIALNLTTGYEFKFTLGDWGREALGNTGQTPSNSKWNGAATQDFIIYNWRGKPVVNQTIPQVLPAGGIASGKMSVVADVHSTDTSIKYYLAPKTSLADRSAPMIPVMSGATATSKVIGAVPKNSAVEYVVVRVVGGVAKTGVNSWGFMTSVKWDGKTNPVTLDVPYFEGDPGIMPVPANLFVVGGATPGGWNNPVPTPSQRFTLIAPGKFELTLALTAGEKYLFLPQNGSWNEKYGGDGKLGGAIVFQGPDIPAPDVSGNYKITVDFTTGKYTLVKV